MRRKNIPVYVLAAMALAMAAPAGAQTTTQPDDTVVEQNALQIVKAQKINDTTVEIYYANGQMMTIDFYGPKIFRIFQDNNGGVIRNPKAEPAAKILVKNPRHFYGVDVDLTVTDETISINTPVKDKGIEVKIDRKTALMTVTDKLAGKVAFETVKPAAFEAPSRAAGLPLLSERAGGEASSAGGEAVLTLACHDGEYFYGGGVQNGRFSHRGTSIAIENTNNWVDGGVSSPTPFYWSTNGYGVLWHTFKPGRYDFGAENPDEVRLSHGEDYLDVFFMVDEKPADLLRDYYQLTGKPVLMPKFGFYEGHLNAYNRDYWTPAEEGKPGFMTYEDGKSYNESQKENDGVRESLNGELPGKYGHETAYQWSARAVIDRYLDNDMPLGWILPNDGYGCGYGQTETLDGNVANLRSFSEYAHSRGVEVGLWTQSDLHPKEGVPALLQRDIVKEVRDGNVRVLKTDVAWVGAGYSFGLNGVADIAEVTKYYGGNARPFIISVDGWAGTQRYATIWTGDQTGGDWEYIRYHIPTFIGAGLSGQPNITNDVDGIFGGKNLPVNVREFQWKTFTPMLLNMDGWGTNPKYPQALGKTAESINRWYLKLKSQLLPYQYTIARKAVDGEPYIRAMFLDYPNNYTYGKQTQYQFLFGPSLLVAPIYKNTAADEEGNDIRDGIYLPEGTWYDYFTGEKYEGGRILNNFDAPLWKLPVFAKGGAIIPMVNPNNNPSQIDKHLRIYQIWPEGKSEFVEYDDDGTTMDYCTKAVGFNTTPIECQQDGDKVRIHINDIHHSIDAIEPNKKTQLLVVATKAPKKVVVKVDGKKIAADVSYKGIGPWINSDAARGNEVLPSMPGHIEINIPEIDIRESNIEVVITGWENAPADPLLTQHGPLAAPRFDAKASTANAYDLTPAWTKVDNADYYEVEYGGMNYSTIRNCSLNFDDLKPLTSYDFRVRAVNADGASEWTNFSYRTVIDPLEYAIKDLRGTTTCKNQGGQGIDKLFDRDVKSMWHTDWGNDPKAVPFDLIVDLRAVNQLDRLEYIPRDNSGNGTILKGTYSTSIDRQTWSEPKPFEWKRDGETKTIGFIGPSISNGPIATMDLRPDLAPEARYIKLCVTEAVGSFGSGQEMYVFRVPGTDCTYQGDINRDNRIDENDLTSYMNYTGVRTIDADYDYVSVGDVNQNGLIDSYDASCASVELDGGVENTNDHVDGSLVLTATCNGKPVQTSVSAKGKAVEDVLLTTFDVKAGDEIELLVTGRNLHCVNALSFALPYDHTLVEYAGIDLLGMKDMVNLTYDRMHSDKTKELFPMFVNRGMSDLLDEGAPELFRLKFKALKAGKFNYSILDGMLVDRNLGVATF